MIEWDDDQRELRGAAHRLGESLSAGHLERDASAEFARDGWRLAQQSGLLALPFDKQWGGLGRDLVTTMYVLEGLGYTCRDGGLSFSLTTHMVSTGIPLQHFGSPELQGRFLPAVCAGELIGAHAITEPEAGSDMLALRTSARIDGDSLVLNGSKAFVTNGPVADLIVVYARTDPEGGPFGTSAILVESDRPGLSVGRPMSKMGLRTSPLSELFLDDCRVPTENVIGGLGSGFLVFDHVMKWEVLCSFIVNVGEMQHRLDRVVEYARTRRQFGSHIGTFQAVAHRIVNMRIAVETARRALYDAASRVMRDEHATEDVAIAKLLASEGNLATATAAVETFGGYGYMTESGIEHDVRGALAGLIYSGTSDIQRNRIAAMMGLSKPGRG
ncbi:acyl-CoA dehydrogenase family protein [Solwaraspora sp. WMMD1047]|uniref:acyl-CoA dehydrogenase family protein n=1 Tax=Solwaraspora sp. WMMD1047 TaxID=3016102 RepID=UPI0024164D9C|nr:acyl-CoA dehydrogenase family protein [Solwaraspora sp. WMMD1047]MDG4830635.1 acyl-CoA dehydrogenase family protein [Solwaraspora sp. WMMD1047]